MHMLNLPRLS